MDITNEQLEVLIDGLCALDDLTYPAEYYDIKNELYDILTAEALHRELRHSQ